MCRIYVVFFENRFVTPSERAHFFCTTPQTLGCKRQCPDGPNFVPEVDLNRSWPRQIDFAIKIQNCETHFARACACFGHFRGAFCTTKSTGKVSRGRTGSSEMSSQNLYFFYKSILNRQGVSRSTSSTQSRVPEKGRFHPKV